MPVFDDMMAAARGEEALEDAPAGTPVLVSRRCVRMLHQASACLKCAEACHAHAISVKPGSVAVDAASCTGCGACAAACPAEALYMRAPGVEQSEAFLERAKTAETLSIACEEAAKDARRMADLKTACLETMDMSLLAVLAAERAGEKFELHFIHGACERCARAGACLNPLKHAEGWKKTLSVTAPEAKVEIHSAPKTVDSSRRQFWGRLLRKAEIDVKPDVPFDEASLAWLESVPLRTVPPARGRWLDALGRLREKKPEAFEALLEAPGCPVLTAPKIDCDACTACGLCQTVCPAAALEEQKANGLTLMKVTAAKCIGCGLCADICFRNAVKLLPVKHPAEALDERPVVIFAKRAEAADAVWEDKLKTMINAPVYRT